MAGLMDILSGAGAALDVPGATVRNALSGRNPFQPISDPFSWEGRTMGRDLLQQYGLAGEDPTGMNMAGGVLAEMALDPLTWAGAGLLSKGLGLGARGAKAASTATRAARPAKALSAGMRPATAASFASPALGAYFIGDNMTVPAEEQQQWKNWLGAGLMAAPLAMAGAKGLKGLGKGRQATAVQAPKEGPYYSRLEEAILNAPEKFEQMPDKVVKGMPEKQVQISPNLMGHRSTVTKTIKGRPEQRTPGQTAHEQLQGYLSERVHPQEVDWILGQQLKDAPEITKQSLMDLFEQRKIGLEVGRHGGAPDLPGTPLVRPAPDGSGSYEAAIRLPDGKIKFYGTFDDRKGALEALKEGRHGPLRFPEMLIPGGKNATEVPIRLGQPKLSAAEQAEYQSLLQMDDAGTLGEAFGKNHNRMIELEKKGMMTGPRFPDTKGHFGDDVAAWVIHDQRTMPDGTTMRFGQEFQSDWAQAGMKHGYFSEVPTKQNTAEMEKTLRSLVKEQDDLRRSLDRRYGRYSLAPDEEYNRYIAMQDAVHELRVRATGTVIDNTKNSLKVPDMPFKGNEATKLGIKQLVSDAIDGGDDYVSFATGDLAARHGAGGVTDPTKLAAIRKHYDEVVPNLVNEMLKPYGVKLERMPLPGSKIGKKEFIVAHTDYSMGDLRLAGKDQIDEIAKAAGWKPGMQEEVLGFRIPDAMKQQVKTRGFPLLSVGGPVAAAAGAQTLRSLLRREPEAA